MREVWDYKRLYRTLLIVLMAILVSMGMFNVRHQEKVYGQEISEGTKVKLVHHHQIRYGSGDGGYSNLMQAKGIDDSIGDRFVFCTQPSKASPPAGTYVIDKMYESDSGKSDVLRKLVYYAKGYPGWEQGKKKWFSQGSWSSDDIYGIFHIAVSYVTAGYNDNMAAWGGGTVKGCMYKDNWQKMIEIVEDCKSENGMPHAPNGFKVFYILNPGCQNIIGGVYETGELVLIKESANSKITEMNSCYSLEGAEFGVFDNDKKVATLITKKDGKSDAVDLKEGTYTVKELKAPKGYAKAPDKNVNVKAGQTSTVTFADKPKVDEIDTILVKGDKETNISEPQGKGSIEGAIYEVKYYKHVGSEKTLDKTWRVITDKNGTALLTTEYLDNSFKNDEFYLSSSGKPCFPLGTVTVKEIKAPKGYLINESIFSSNITDDNNENEIVDSYVVPSIGSDISMGEQIIRGDIEFVKVADGSLKRMANIPFKITSLTTGENHIVVSDRNGYVSTSSSWNKHSLNTNRGETCEDGIWFGSGNADDSVGALIYDDYEIEEIRCEANKGMKLLKFNFSIYKNSLTVPLGTLTNDEIKISKPEYEDDTGSKEVEEDKPVTIIDTPKTSDERNIALCMTMLLIMTASMIGIVYTGMGKRKLTRKNKGD